MKRATMTFTDDLAKAAESYRRAQETPPTLTVVVQTALRSYLTERGYLRAHMPLKLTAVGRSGRADISIEHDAYRAAIKK